MTNDEPLPESLFEQLLEALHGSKDERAVEAHVAELCRRHPEHAQALTAELELARSTGEQPVPRSKHTAAPDWIGPYRILDLLGEGGMGAVYRAERQRPVRQVVAVKVVKQGLATKEVLGRFELERRALAAMSHRSIARVLDAGSTERGEPYFVMELVEGLPINVYCDRHRLSLRDRLRLFQQVCGAVQHAHQKGVVHRDLKPGNVLVAREGDDAVPKILDFGLAKATNSDFLAASFVTERDRIMGTPEYMAPEQAAGDGEVIDVRADVYSLGVMLYELLTGSLPFSTGDLRRAGALDALRMIREAEPPKPSTKFASSVAVAVQAAEHRRVSVTRLTRELRGDLDWIVLKALAKEPERRYDAAVSLAADIERHLTHEPVLAGPPSARYRLRKLARRYRTQLLVVGAVVVTAVGGGLLALSYARVATANARQARAARAEFDQLAVTERLRRTEAARPALLAPWPENAARLAAWLEQQAEPLLEDRPALEAVLDELRARATPRPGAPGAPDAAVRFAQLELETIQRAISPLGDDGEVPSYLQGLQATTLNRIAYYLVHENQGMPRMHGGSLLGLLLARLARARCEQGDKSIRLDYVLDTLALACVQCGFDEEALSSIQRALEIGAETDKADYRATREAIEALIAGREVRADQLQEAVDAAVSTRQEWRWPRAEEQVLGDALTQTLSDLDILHAEVLRQRERLQWAERVAELSIDRHRQRWDDAIAALAASDGRRAHTAYGGLVITPQVGLVPLGVDPRTGLWLFYHLRSARDPEVLPDLDGTTGEVAVHEGTGVVFVLLPPGCAWIGAQDQRPEALGYDPMAAPDEGPVHPVLLDAFFVARHELTKAQWRRLAGESHASYYEIGERYEADDPVTWRHPVDSVKWTEARAVLLANGLILPTESQWEYACRAGQSAPWSCGEDPGALGRVANLRDATFANARNDHDAVAPFDDGVVTLAEVGRYEPNAFGLCDMHGNLAEWCRDDYGRYLQPIQVGTGERLVLAGGRGEKVVRGGDYTSTVREARSSRRLAVRPDTPFALIGVRAARPLH